MISLSHHKIAIQMLARLPYAKLETLEKCLTEAEHFIKYGYVDGKRVEKVKADSLIEESVKVSEILWDLVKLEYHATHAFTHCSPFSHNAARLRKNQ